MLLGSSFFEGTVTGGAVVADGGGGPFIRLATKIISMIFGGLCKGSNMVWHTAWYWIHNFVATLRVNNRPFFMLYICSLVWGGQLDTWSRPSVVHDWYRFPTFNTFFTAAPTINLPKIFVATLPVMILLMSTLLLLDDVNDEAPRDWIPVGAELELFWLAPRVGMVPTVPTELPKLCTCKSQNTYFVII